MQQLLPLPLLLVLLFAANIAKAEEEPIVTMVTKFNTGKSFFLVLGTEEEGTSVKIDYGDGKLVEKTLGTMSFIDDKNFKGNSIKIYGTPTCLTRLKCKHMGLTNLDIRNAKSLKILDCSNNSLTSLNLSNNLALEDLSCGENELTSLDISKNNLLTDISCGFNKITNIDTDKKTALKYLFCTSNKLTELNLENNTVLRQLKCSYNNITKLEINSTALSLLECENSNLKNLDVSKCNALDALECNNNNLESLNLSRKTALRYIECENNKLTSLIVDNCTSLKTINCSNNQLPNLDLNSNTTLSSLYCDNNNLTSLDVSNTKVSVLFCSKNKLTSINMGHITRLLVFSCSENSLSFSSMPLQQMYLYSPQNNIVIDNAQSANGVIDLSSENLIYDTQTIYTWKTATGTILKEGEDYTITNGITTFKKAQTQKVYCEMTNSSYPKLTLATNPIIVSNITSTKSKTEENILIYPNPASNELNVKQDSIIEQIKVFTSSGNMVYKMATNQKHITIPTANLTNGIYLLKIEGRRGTTIRRFVKK